MNFRCYIVDDEEHAIELLCKYIQKTPGLEIAGHETNPLVALNAIGSHDIQVDIAFLDIDMPELSGMDLASLLQDHTHIVFTTAFKDYAVKAFEQRTLDYMLKPVTYERFLKSISKARDIKNTEKPQGERSHFFVPHGGGLLRIDHDALLYTEGAGNYIRCHLEGDVLHLVYLTMHELEEHLPPGRFARVHRSHHVNLNKIKHVDSGMIHLSDGSAVPLGKGYRKGFDKTIENFVIRSRR